MSVLCTRLHSKNLSYACDSLEVSLKPTKPRYLSGFEFSTRSKMSGMVFGHLVRFVDNSNLWSSGVLPFDIAYLLKELRESGWTKRVFTDALLKLSFVCPQLESVIDTCHEVVRQMP